MSTAVLRVVSNESGQIVVPTGQPRFIIGRARNADYVIADSRAGTLMSWSRMVAVVARA